MFQLKTIENLTCLKCDRLNSTALTNLFRAFSNLLNSGETIRAILVHSELPPPTH